MIKDLVPILLGRYVSFHDAYLVIATYMIFIVPLTLIKDVSSLAYVSSISIALSALLAAVIITTAPFKQNVADHGGLWQVTQDYGFRSHCFTTISIFTEVRFILFYVSWIKNNNNNEKVDCTYPSHVFRFNRYLHGNMEFSNS